MRINRVLVAVGAVVTTIAIALPAEALPSFSTGAKSAPDPSATVTQLWNLRAGNNGTFDRIVFDERISPSGFSVRYVSRVVADPSGQAVSLKGRYFLRVVITGAAKSSTMPSSLTPGLSEVAQIRSAGEFEQVVSYGIGLNRYRGFRVFRLSSPDRLVLDILH